MHHHDDALAFFGGATLAMLARVLEWASSGALLGQLAETILFGVVGGAASMTAKLIIERFFKGKGNRKPKTDKNNP